MNTLKVKGRITKMDKYKKLHILHDSRASCGEFEKILDKYDGSKPYFACPAGRGFMAKPNSNLLVRTSEGLLPACSDRLLGMNLILLVKIKKYDFVDKNRNRRRGVNLIIINMYEEGVN